MTRLRNLASAALAAMLLATAAVEARTPPELYRGSDEVLAVWNGKDITEEDLFLFQVTALRDPYVALDWQEAVRARETGRLEALRKAILGMIVTQEIAEKDPRAAQFRALPSLDLGARLLAGLYSRTAWTDAVVRSTVTVEPVDIAYHYRKNWRDFATPERTRTLRARVEVPQPVTPQSFLEARTRAEELRRQALKAGGLRAVLDQNPDLIADTGAAPIVIERGGGEVEPEVEAAAFATVIGEISLPVETPGAVFLLEVIDREPAQIPPLTEVASEIEEVILPRILSVRSEYMLAKARRKARPIDRSPYFANSPDDGVIFRVRDTEMTRGQFTELFPGVVGDPEKPNELLVRSAVAGAIMNEVATQELERAGLLGATEFARAFEYGRTIIVADAVRAVARAQADPTDEEAEAYLAKHRDELLPEARRVLWEWKLEPRRPTRLSEEARQALSLVMRGLLQQLVEDARLALDDRNTIVGGGTLMDPEPVFQRLSELQDDRVRVNFAAVGEHTPASALSTFNVEIGDLGRGDFSEVRRRPDGSVVVYYVAEVRPAAAVTNAQLLDSARGALTFLAADYPFMQRLEADEAAGRLRFMFPVGDPAAGR
jgi:hypothetical protein